MSTTLRVIEIYRAIQGESLRAGRPCVMVRLAGCNLRCAWCDTIYAQSPEAGKEMSLDDVLDLVAAEGIGRVELTGGEPLMQPAATKLLTLLCDAGYETLLETNGSVDLAGVDPRVIRVVDFKCPSSGEAAANRWSNVALLQAGDEVKFVLADRADFDFAVAAVIEHGLSDRVAAVTFSPVWGRLDPAELAAWILTERLEVRLGLQMHRVIWDEADERQWDGRDLGEGRPDPPPAVR